MLGLEKGEDAFNGFFFPSENYLDFPERKWSTADPCDLCPRSSLPQSLSFRAGPTAVLASLASGHLEVILDADTSACIPSLWSGLHTFSSEGTSDHIQQQVLTGCGFLYWFLNFSCSCNPKD